MARPSDRRPRYHKPLINEEQDRNASVMPKESVEILRKIGIGLNQFRGCASDPKEKYSAHPDSGGCLHAGGLNPGRRSTSAPQCPCAGGGGKIEIAVDRGQDCHLLSFEIERQLNLATPRKETIIPKNRPVSNRASIQIELTK